MTERAKIKVDKASPVSIEIVTITPKMAAKWLADDEADPNRRNRGISGPTIAAYARDMAAGRWQLSEAAICFDVDGTLINGQHRLHACCMAERSFDVMVMRGLPRKAQEAMDLHRPRNIRDILHMRGYVNTTVLSGAARRLLDIKDVADGRPNIMGVRVTMGELTAIVERHPNLVESASFCSGHDTTKVRGIAMSLAVALHYLGKNILKEGKKADEFIKVFKTGIPAYTGDPAHKLREKMLTRGHVHHVMKPREQLYCGIRAWNAFVGGEKLERFLVPRQPVSVYKLDPDLI